MESGDSAFFGIRSSLTTFYAWVSFKIDFGGVARPIRLLNPTTARS
jgi:hypothetical protein